MDGHQPANRYYRSKDDSYCFGKVQRRGALIVHEVNRCTADLVTDKLL